MHSFKRSYDYHKFAFGMVNANMAEGSVEALLCNILGTGQLNRLDSWH